jgi:hypothetical protein
VTKAQGVIDPILVAATMPLGLHVSGANEIAYEGVREPLCDADSVGNVSQPRVGMVCQKMSACP